jgi:eukaryotic-like serine/threonine-protein kinase
MLSGRRAFRGDTAADVISAILHEDPPELTATDHPVPPALDRIVRHCLEKEPRQRFQSADDIAFHLSEVSATSDASASQLAVTRQPFWSRRRAITASVAVLALAIASAAGYWVGAGEASAASEFHQLTFQEGKIDSACFAPDGETVIFAANWGGNGTELYSARIDSAAGVRPLGLRADSIASISRTGELALLSNRGFGDPHAPATLSRVPLGGGSPRAILDDVVSADWSGDGNQLAVSHAIGNVMRIEYPVGKVVIELGGGADNLHISPDGRYIAFSNHPEIGDDRGTIDIVDVEGHHRVLTQEWSSIGSLVWSPSGKEIWFTAAAEGLGRQPHAVTLDGKLRSLFYAPGNVRIVASRPNGRLLVIDDTRRKRLMVSTPEFPEERNLAWLDWPNGAAFSPDGKQIVFSEQNGPVGLHYSIFLRNIDGSPAVRLGEGDIPRISPDGKWVLAVIPGLPAQLSLIPTGAGEAHQLTHGAVFHWAAAWLPDSQHVISLAWENSRPDRDYLLDLNGNENPLTPEGTVGVTVTPDGTNVLVHDAKGAWLLFPIHGGAAKPVNGLEAGDWPIRFSPDGRRVYVARSVAANEGKFWTVDLATGKRELFKDIKLTEPGVYRVQSFTLSPDTRSFAYIYGRTLSTLYYVDRVR